MRRVLANEKGISLIELLVSVTILGIIVIPLASVFGGALRFNADAGDQLKANQLAQKYMELAKSGGSGGEYSEADGFLARVDIVPYGSAVDFGTGPEITFDSMFVFEGGVPLKMNILNGGGGTEGSFDLDPETCNKVTLFVNSSQDGSSQSLVAYNGSNISTAPDLSRIKVTYSEEGAFYIEVYNNLDSEVDLYIAGEHQNIVVVPMSGTVRTYYNFNDEPPPAAGLSRLDKITVTVEKGGNTLAKLTGLKRNN